MLSIKNFFFSLSIHKKLAIGITCIITFIFLSTALIALNVANNQTSKIVEELIDSNIHSNQEFLNSSILEKNSWELFKFLKAFSQSSIIKSAGIIDNENKVIAHSIPKQYKIGDFFEDKGTNKIIHISSNEIKIGSIILEVEKSSINQMLKNVFLKNALFLVISAVFLFIIMSLFTKKLLDRFKVIVSNMSAISKKEWSKIQKNTSNEKDEISALIDQSINIMEDIKTGIKKEEELRVFYRDILKSIDSFIVICDNDMTIKYHNNHSLGEFLLDENKISFIEEFIQEIQKKDEKENSFTLELKNSSFSHLLINIQYLDNNIVIHFSDISRLKEIEENEKIMHSLHVVGEISSQFAHEVKNLLQPLTLLIPKNSLPDKEDLPIIHNTLGKMREQVSDFLFLGKPLEINNQSQENAIVVLNDSLKIFDSLIKEKNLKINIDTVDTLYLPLDKKHLELIVINIIKNAIEASFPNEEIFISWVKYKNENIFTVINSGENIKDTQKIFKPFFTTKNKGSGLGLFSIYKLIHTLKGRIEVHSTNNITSFKIYIPNRIEI